MDGCEIFYEKEKLIEANYLQMIFRDKKFTNEREREREIRSGFPSAVKKYGDHSRFNIVSFRLPCQTSSVLQRENSSTRGAITGSSRRFVQLSPSVPVAYLIEREGGGEEEEKLLFAVSQRLCKITFTDSCIIHPASRLFVDPHFTNFLLRSAIFCGFQPLLPNF